MTREQEIRQAAINHICDDTEQLLVLFIEGAKWADEHPNPDMVNKQEFIDKAREILKNTIVDDIFANRGSVIKYMSINEFVEYFCKAMKE